jgi:hypothetical protein
MKNYLLILTTALLALPVFAEEPAAEEASPLSITLTAGYDSRYMLYGYRLNRHLLGADAYVAYALDDHTTLWGGSWFGIIPDGTYRELDGYVGVDRVLGHGFTAGFAISAFYYVDVPFTQRDVVYELMTHLMYSKGPFSFDLRDHADTLADGHILRSIATYTQPIHDRVSLKGTAEFGYAFEYYIEGNLPNHALFTIEAPTVISPAVWVTPFITRSIPLAASDSFEEEDTIFGGSISWSL